MQPFLYRDFRVSSSTDLERHRAACNTWYHCSKSCTDDEERKEGRRKEGREGGREGGREESGKSLNIVEDVAERGEMIIDSHMNLEANVIPNDNTGRQDV